MHTARPRLRSSNAIRSWPLWLGYLLNHLLHPSRPQEHAISLLTLKVPLPLDGAIILAAVLLKLYTYPVARLEMCRAKISDGRDAVVIQFDSLAYSER
jgi:hypothetical protein